ncbi:MAG: hypothetical protein ISR65_07635 [Bacteriovoracaceae bacterium]|nr:hypothetical protein [Bacteriovoracaceae bacterium]
MNIKYPIIIKDESNYVELYNSTTSAIKDVEICDIQDGIYEVFDTTGRILMFTYDEYNIENITSTDIIDKARLEEILNKSLTYYKENKLNRDIEFNLPLNTNEAISILIKIKKKCKSDTLLNKLKSFFQFG